VLQSLNHETGRQFAQLWSAGRRLHIANAEQRDLNRDHTRSPAMVEGSGATRGCGGLIYDSTTRKQSPI
jgi:hypothetical protein